MYDVTVIGPAVIDVLASPFDADAFSRDADSSRYMDGIRMSYGGDALNESTVLARLGKRVQLISRIGEDEAGKSILGHLQNNGISTGSILVQEGLETSVNIALIAGDGSRRFLMNRNSSLRSLGPEDVLPYFRRSTGENPSAGLSSSARLSDRPYVSGHTSDRLYVSGHTSDGLYVSRHMSDGQSSSRQSSCMQPASGQKNLTDPAGIVSFASMFISPLFTIDRMRELFSAVKAAGKTLVVDVTRPKNGETLEDLRELLPYIDVFVPNDEEIRALTGERDPEKNARLLVKAGVGTAVVKTGGDGCIVGTGMQAREIGRCTAWVQPETEKGIGDSARSKSDVMGSGGFPGRQGLDRMNPARPSAEAETERKNGKSGVQILHVPAVPGIRCVDTTGAGDTFAAGFIAGLCNGWSAEACARLGCAAASCSIEQIGATDGVRTLDQVMERYAMLCR